MTTRGLLSDAVIVGLLLGVVHCSPTREQAASDSAVTPSPAGLGGTFWRLVEFQGGDETMLKPDDPTKYTIAFGADGSLSARIDCNRGRFTIRSSSNGRTCARM